MALVDPLHDVAHAAAPLVGLEVADQQPVALRRAAHVSLRLDAETAQEGRQAPALVGDGAVGGDAVGIQRHGEDLVGALQHGRAAAVQQAGLHAAVASLVRPEGEPVGQALAVDHAAADLHLARGALAHGAVSVLEQHLQGEVAPEVLLVDDEHVRRGRAPHGQYLVVELDGEHERTVVAGDQLRIPLQEAVVVHHAGVVLELEALPPVDGIAVHDVVHPDVLDDAALVVVGHVAHRGGQGVHGRESLVETLLLQELVIGVVPVQVVLRLPGPGLAAAQDLVADEREARRRADGALLAPVDDLVAVLRAAQVFVFIDVERVMVDPRTAGVVVVPPAVVAEFRLEGHQVCLEAGVGLVLGVLPVAGVVDQDARGVEPVAHRHLLVVLPLRGGPALVVHVVDHERGMAAVAQDHPAQLLVAVREIEAALQVVIREAVRRILVAARLLPVEQAQLVRPVQHAALADGAVEVEHVETQRLGGLDLAARQLVRRHDAVLRPETPGDGRTRDDALAVQVELPVARHVADLEPAEAEAAGVAVLPHPDRQVVEVGLVHAPEFRLGQADVDRADVLARGPLAVPGLAVQLPARLVADAQRERLLRGAVGLHRDLHRDGVRVRPVLDENV